MNIYNCSGTLGDTYITLCILYKIAICEPIICEHYTAQYNWRHLIKQIYSLLPNIKVQFVNTRSDRGLRIYSTFTDHLSYGRIFNNPDNWQLFPYFNLPYMSSLPQEYIVLNPIAGRTNQDRQLRTDIIQGTIEQTPYPVIIIGTDDRLKCINGPGVINLVGKTSLPEAIGIVSKAKKMITFQGIMSMVSLSHKVPSNIYMTRKDDEPFVSHRLPDAWKQYCYLIRYKDEL